jgi:signal transduction histidine kinase
VPRYDAEGRFAGYLGTARPIDVERAQQGDHAALLLLKAWPGPVWLLEQPHAGARWTLVHGNEAAAQLLPRRPTPQATDLEALMAALPDGLGPALSPLVATGGSATVGDWEARLEHSADRGDGSPALLLLGLLPRTAMAAEPAEQASFIYTISHDLRAPIRVVEGFTRILKEDYGRLLDRIGNDHFDRVLGAAARMNTMIDALLSLSALSTQPLQRQPVNLSQLARFIVDDLRRQAPQRTVQVDIADGLAATGDPTLLRLVLENLLGNAWKYSTKREAAQIAFEATEHDGRAAFVVRDNGAGFDMRFADRLFGVFQRLHSANDFAGTGVGLASVRRIVRRHGGDVWAESEVGQGARFYFTLAGSIPGNPSRPTPLPEISTQ